MLDWNTHRNIIFFYSATAKTIGLRRKKVYGLGNAALMPHKIFTKLEQLFKMSDCHTHITIKIFVGQHSKVYDLKKKRKKYKYL